MTVSRPDTPSQEKMCTFSLWITHCSSSKLILSHWHTICVSMLAIFFRLESFCCLPSAAAGVSCQKETSLLMDTGCCCDWTLHYKTVSATLSPSCRLICLSLYFFKDPLQWKLEFALFSKRQQRCFLFGLKVAKGELVRPHVFPQESLFGRPSILGSQRVRANMLVNR